MTDSKGSDTAAQNGAETISDVAPKKTARPATTKSASRAKTSKSASGTGKADKEKSPAAKTSPARGTKSAAVKDDSKTPPSATPAEEKAKSGTEKGTSRASARSTAKKEPEAKTGTTAQKATRGRPRGKSASQEDKAQAGDSTKPAGTTAAPEAESSSPAEPKTPAKSARKSPAKKSAPKSTAKSRSDQEAAPARDAAEKTAPVESAEPPVAQPAASVTEQAAESAPLAEEKKAGGRTAAKSAKAPAAKGKKAEGEAKDKAGEQKAAAAPKKPAKKAGTGKSGSAKSASPPAVSLEASTPVDAGAQTLSEESLRPEVALPSEKLENISISPTALIADVGSGSFAPFPSEFDDASPEDFFEGVEGEVKAEGEAGGKKRRSRGRRGRGRKKGAGASPENGVAVQSGEAEPTEAHESAAPKPEQPKAVAEKEKTSAKDKAPAEETEDQTAAGKASRRKMFVSVLPEEQVEVVITEEGQVLEYYVEMLHQAKTKGNIYKGTIHNVDPNLQAAFVSYGAVKNGFLQIDEVHPEYYVVAHEAEKGRKYPPIQKVLKPGQEVLVQVVKEPAGTKGAFLTTYLSMPGRYLVLTPGREQIGVSRKVENEKERARLRELLEGLSPGPGLGVIVRTVSMGASKTSLQRDLQYLKRTWKDVRTRGTTEKAPCLVYQEQDLTARAVRDYLTESIGEVWVDDEHTAEEVMEIAQALFPRKQNLVRQHNEESGTSLFERFNLQRQLDQIHSREVSLPSGGRLVIDATEALTAIDINSGRSGGKSNFEDMAYRTNMEAAKMIPLQLRLRDIGGQVVADFIEMRDKNHWREVEKTLRAGMKVDRARYDVGKIGPFGMLEIVRQRLGSSAISVSTEPCPCCQGTGMRRNMEWQSQHALREILRALRTAKAQNQPNVCYKTDVELAMHLLNHKRRRLLEMEQSYGVQLDIEIGSAES